MSTVFPTAYFGSILYFQHLAAAKDPVIELHEHFVKQTLRSRCRIPVSNGIRNLSVPVIRISGSKTPVRDVRISYVEKWQKDHWKTIESAYSHSPYFEHYSHELRELIYSGPEFLTELNDAITATVSSWLSIDVKPGVTSEYTPSVESIDYRSFPFDDPLDTKPYVQVFSNELGFLPNLSILDLIMNEGPMARNWIINSFGK